MGNTCFKSSKSILEEIGFFQYVSNPTLVGDDPETLSSTLGSSSLLVPNQPASPTKPQLRYSGALEAGSVLQRKTCHVKELYMLGGKLGQGIFGTTFQCVEKETGKEYACKSIAKSKLNEKEDVEDVRNEVQIMEHLAVAGHQHPNVISIRGAYEDSEAVHLVMELCSGGELLARIIKKGHYSEREAAKLIKMIVGAVEACHSLGVMHRDLKPENLMFVDEKEDSPLKLIDFGLSTFFKPGETFNDLVGTSNYAAPEVVLRKPYGPEVDVWSTGVIMYILLSGVPPFYAETELEIFKQVLYGELDFSAHPWPSISRSAKDLVKKMLVRDPERRLTARQVLCHPWVAQVHDGAAHPHRSSSLAYWLNYFCTT